MTITRYAYWIDAKAKCRCSVDPKADGAYVLYDDYDALAAETATLKARLAEVRRVCDEQANDEGLWFVAVTVTEDYLQAALRRLHAAVEGTASQPPSAHPAPWTAGLLGYPCQACGEALTADHSCKADQPSTCTCDGEYKLDADCPEHGDPSFANVDRESESHG